MQVDIVNREIAMATRSNIAVQQDDGTFLFIYVHNDGYFEGVGQDLHDHYSDIEKARQLVALGDLSIVGREIGEKHDFDEPRWEFAVKPKTPETLARAALVESWCRSYGRDRGETNIEARAIADEDGVFGAFAEQYLYVMKADDAGAYAWHTHFRGKLEPLSNVLTTYEDDEDDED